MLAIEFGQDGVVFVKGRLDAAQSRARAADPGNDRSGSGGDGADAGAGVVRDQNGRVARTGGAAGLGEHHWTDYGPSN